MQKQNLDASQLRSLNLFNLILETGGWADVDNTEWKMDRGVDLIPEGYRAYKYPTYKLHCAIHLPLDLISVHMTKPRGSRIVTLHAFFDENPERFLEWIVAHRDALTPRTWRGLLNSARQNCSMLLMKLPRDAYYEVEVSGDTIHTNLEDKLK